MIYKIDIEANGKTTLKTSIKGKSLLFHPRLNKGNAFSYKERKDFALMGKLPPVVESLDTQVNRVYHQYSRVKGNHAKSIFLHALFNINEILFYALVTRYISEITDKLYTPTVSESVKDYSVEYRQPRGIFISYKDEEFIEDILANRTNSELDIIVISDGEAILGIGDQGVGGMGIPVAKAAMHVVAGGVSPYRIAPLFVDVGTNNAALLKDPYYLGLKETRLGPDAYRKFLTLLLNKIYALFPDVVIHFEDFSKNNARWLLDTFGKSHPCFNDDIQGTAAIVLSAIMTALHRKNESIADQRIMLVGPGAAGLGILETLLAYLKINAPATDDFCSNIWLIGRNGVVTDDIDDDYLQPFAKDRSLVEHWTDTSFETAVKKVKPTILIGVTGKADLFHADIIKEIFDHVEKPIILPLSNPSLQSECVPQAVYDQVDQPFFIATGSPFAIQKDSEVMPVSQCNNLYAFPAIASGMVACKANRLSQEMIIAVAEHISRFTLSRYDNHMTITPMLDDLSDVADEAAVGLINSACKSGSAQVDYDTALQRFNQLKWTPHYIDYVYTSGIIEESA